MARGITHQGAFGTQAIQDIIDTDAFQGPFTTLTGTADAINPHVSGNYLIATGSADAITLGLPTAGVDDNLTIAIYSSTAFPHTVTLPSAQFGTGTSVLRTIATFTTGFIGQGVLLRANAGMWYVLSTTGTVTFT